MFFKNRILNSEEKARIIENLKEANALRSRELENPIYSKPPFLGVPNNYVLKYKSALDGKVTVHQALKIKCLECCCWNREEITNCTAKTCPLWHYRPFNK